MPIPASPTTLQHLLDQQAIRDIEARYCEAIDEYDLDEVLALFTEDCITDYGPGRGGAEVGTAAMRRRWENQPAGSGSKSTHHQLGQVRIELAGDEAACVSYCTANHERRNGERITFRFQYRDRLRRTPAGWRISHRKLLFTVVDGNLGPERTWLGRKDPRP